MRFHAFLLPYTGMPTKKPRRVHSPDNLPAKLDPKDICPAVYTGDKLYIEQPERYARIAQGLAEGMSAIRLAKAEKVAPATVAAILKREKDAIEGSQRLTAGLTSIASQATLEKLIDALDADQVPPASLAICFGILRDKERQDLGLATQTIEVKKTVSLDEVKAHLATLREARDADVIEIDGDPEAA